MSKPIGALDRVKAEAQASRAFTTLYLPKLIGAVKRLQTMTGPEIEAALPPFLIEADRLRRTVQQHLTTPEARARFERLTLRHQNDEVTGLSVLAAGRNAHYRHGVHRDFLRSQIDWALLWPDNDARAESAAQTGLAAIAAHYARAPEDRETAAGLFLSDLTAARVKALATTNIAKAWTVLQANRTALNPARLRDCQQLLIRQDKLFRARVLTDAIIAWGNPEDWMNKADEAAQTEFPGDADFKALVGTLIAERLDERRQAQLGAQRTARNLLLRIVLNHRLGRLDALLAHDPATDGAWMRITAPERRNLLELLRRHRTKANPVEGAAARARYHLALGLYHADPDAFVRVDLTGTAFASLPKGRMLTLIRLQDGLDGSDDPDRRAILAHLIAPCIPALTQHGIRPRT